MELLDVLKHAAEFRIVQNWRDRTSGDDKCQCQPAAEPDEFFLRGILRKHPAKDIHRGDRGRRVQQRGQRAGDGTGDGGVDEPAHARRNQLGDHRGKRRVGFRAEFSAVELLRHQPRHHHREGHEQPETTRENHPELAVFQRLRGQVPLHNELVQTAVINHHDPHPASHASPWKILVIRRHHHVKLRRVELGKLVPAADSVQTEEENQHPTREQRQTLHQVSPRDCLQAADRRITRAYQTNQPHRLG